MTTVVPANEGPGGAESDIGDNPENVTSEDVPNAERPTTHQETSQQQQHPPPSPLSGCYLLVVLPEPHTAQHKDLILNRLAKGFLSWDIQNCHVDLEKELESFVAQAPEGEEARNGERLIQYATENLVTEVLIHPQTNTLFQCIRNLLASFTKHRHIIHAGYTYSGNGSWILQDGTFSFSDFLDAFSEHEVQRVIRAYENSVTVDIHCVGVGEWTTSIVSNEYCTRACQVRINPDDVLTAGVPTVASFTNYIGQYLIPQTLDQLMEPSDIVGNIRFSHPTLYVFPAGQGDAALFGINGFNMLVDGGFARKACFWDFARHLDRLDAVLVTRVNNGNIGGISNLLRKKKEMHVYPQIGYFFCNLVERRDAKSPDGDKDSDPLILNLIDLGQEMMVNLRHINLRAHPCYRDPEPINLYHKVGHGKLDMYVLSPSKDSKEVREFLAKWDSSDSKLFAGHQIKDSNSIVFPIQNLVSICALLVWQPANPQDRITRILFPGSSPQHKIFQGFERVKHLEFLKRPVCTAKHLSPSESMRTIKEKPILSKPKLKAAERETNRILDVRKEKRDIAESKSIKREASVDDTGKVVSAKSFHQIPYKTESKAKKVIENKLIDSEIEEKKLIAKDVKEIAEETNKKTEPKQETEKTVNIKDAKTEIVDFKKKDAKDVKSQTKTTKADLIKRTSVKVVEKKIKLQPDKKDVIKSSPTTPKKTISSTSSKLDASKLSIKATIRAAPRSSSTAPAKSAKDANNRLVVEQKNNELSSSKQVFESGTKFSSKTQISEKKQTVRKIKTSPSKSRFPISPAKTSKTTSTLSNSERNTIIRKAKTDTRNVSSTLRNTNAQSIAKVLDQNLLEKSEDMSLDSIECKVVADSKEEDKLIEVAEVALKEENLYNEGKDEHIIAKTQKSVLDFFDKKEEEVITEEDVTAEMEDMPKKSYGKESHEVTEEEEYLIVEKEEIYTEDSVQSCDAEQKHHIDEVQSEKSKNTTGEKQEKIEEPEKDESEEKIDELPEKMIAATNKAYAINTIFAEEKGNEDIEKGSSVDEISKDIDDNHINIAKEVSDAAKEKTEINKKESEIEAKLVHDHKELVVEKIEESQEKMSTLESGATTTAPTLPEDERMPLDEIKEDVNEKYVLEDVKEKDNIQKKRESFTDMGSIAKPDIQKFELCQPNQIMQKDSVKTPDEVADLPVHEEVDPNLYDVDAYKDKENKVAVNVESEIKEQSVSPPEKEKGVLGFFGKVADKFEKGIDKLTKKTRRDSEEKQTSPKELKTQDSQSFAEVDPEKVFLKMGKPSESLSEIKTVKAYTDEDIKPFDNSKNNIASEVKDSESHTPLTMEAPTEKGESPVFAENEQAQNKDEKAVGIIDQKVESVSTILTEKYIEEVEDLPSFEKKDSKAYDKPETYATVSQEIRSIVEEDVKPFKTFDTVSTSQMEPLEEQEVKEIISLTATESTLDATKCLIMHEKLQGAEIVKEETTDLHQCTPDLIASDNEAFYLNERKHSSQMKDAESKQMSQSAKNVPTVEVLPITSTGKKHVSDNTEEIEKLLEESSEKFKNVKDSLQSSLEDLEKKIEEESRCKTDESQTDADSKQTSQSVKNVLTVEVLPITSTEKKHVSDNTEQIEELLEESSKKFKNVKDSLQSSLEDLEKKIEEESKKLDEVDNMQGALCDVAKKLDDIRSEVESIIEPKFPEKVKFETPLSEDIQDQNDSDEIIRDFKEAVRDVGEVLLGTAGIDFGKEETKILEKRNEVVTTNVRGDTVKENVEALDESHSTISKKSDEVCFARKESLKIHDHEHECMGFDDDLIPKKVGITEELPQQEEIEEMFDSGLIKNLGEYEQADNLEIEESPYFKLEKGKSIAVVSTIVEEQLSRESAKQICEELLKEDTLVRPTVDVVQDSDMDVMKSGLEEPCVKKIVKRSITELPGQSHYKEESNLIIESKIGFDQKLSPGSVELVIVSPDSTPTSPKEITDTISGDKEEKLKDPHDKIVEEKTLISPAKDVIAFVEDTSKDNESKPVLENVAGALRKFSLDKREESLESASTVTQTTAVMECALISGEDRSSAKDLPPPINENKEKIELEKENKDILAEQSAKESLDNSDKSKDLNQEINLIFTESEDNMKCHDKSEEPQISMDIEPKTNDVLQQIKDDKNCETIQQFQDENAIAKTSSSSGNIDNESLSKSKALTVAETLTENEEHYGIIDQNRKSSMSDKTLKNAESSEIPTKRDSSSEAHILSSECALIGLETNQMDTEQLEYIATDTTKTSLPQDLAGKENLEDDQGALIEPETKSLLKPESESTDAHEKEEQLKSKNTIGLTELISADEKLLDEDNFTQEATARLSITSEKFDEDSIDHTKSPSILSDKSDDKDDQFVKVEEKTGTDSRKTSLSSTEVQVDEKSRSRSQSLFAVEENASPVLSKTASETDEKFKSERITLKSDQEFTTDNEKIVQYIFNEYIDRKKIIRNQDIEEISFIYNVPISDVMNIINGVIEDLKLEKKNIYDLFTTAKDNESSLQELPHDFLKNMTDDKETLIKFIYDEYLSQNKKIDSKTVNNIAISRSVSRYFVIAVIEDIILADNLRRESIVVNDFSDNEDLSPIKSPDAKQSAVSNIKLIDDSADHMPKELTLSDNDKQSKSNQSSSTITYERKESTTILQLPTAASVESGMAAENSKVQEVDSIAALQENISDDSYSRPDPYIDEEVSISENKRNELESVLIDNYISKKIKITDTVLDEIIFQTGTPKYIILEVIDEIILKRKIPRYDIADKFIFPESERDDEETLDDVKETKLEDAVPEACSSKDYHLAQQNLLQKISDPDYESPFLKAFVEGVSEMRTTHITTLSGVNTPDSGTLEFPSEFSEIKTSVTVQDVTEGHDIMSETDAQEKCDKHMCKVVEFESGHEKSEVKKDLVQDMTDIKGKQQFENLSGSYEMDDIHKTNDNVHKESKSEKKIPNQQETRLSEVKEQAIDTTSVPLSDVSTSAIIRDGSIIQSHFSGQSTPDKRTDSRSRTATPEGLRTGEVMRTIITTTRTMSNDGEIITTTQEVTETTNDKGERIVLAEKTDVKVDEKLPEISETLLKNQDASFNLESSVLSHSSNKDELDSKNTQQLSEKQTVGSKDYNTGGQKDLQTETCEFISSTMTSSFYGDLPSGSTEFFNLVTAVHDTSLESSDFTFKQVVAGKELLNIQKEEEAKKNTEDPDLDVGKVFTDTPSHSEQKRGSHPTVDSATELSTKPSEEKDPLADWGSPLGLPSPKPPRKFNLHSPIPQCSSADLSPDSLNHDIINDWGEPMRLPSPTPTGNEISEKHTPETPVKQKKDTNKKIIIENIKNKKKSESSIKNEKKLKDAKNKIQPVYVDLTYVSHHGNSFYAALDFFKKVRARYYVFSGIEPSREVYDALLQAKMTWEDDDLEVTMIPTYDTDILGYWVADNEEILTKYHIDLSPSASRCTINLQDHETSCSAYRLEF